LLGVPFGPEALAFAAPDLLPPAPADHRLFGGAAPLLGVAAFLPAVFVPAQGASTAGTATGLRGDDTTGSTGLVSTGPPDDVTTSSTTTMTSGTVGGPSGVTTSGTSNSTGEVPTVQPATSGDSNGAAVTPEPASHGCWAAAWPRSPAGTGHGRNDRAAGLER